MTIGDCDARLRAGSVALSFDAGLSLSPKHGAQALYARPAKILLHVLRNMNLVWRNRTSRVVLWVIALATCATPSAATTPDWGIDAHVVVVESSYMPGTLDFQIDAPAGTCAAGGWLVWNISGADEPSKIANAQANLSVLMSAFLSGKRVRVVGNNAGCVVNYLWLEP